MEKSKTRRKLVIGGIGLPTLWTTPVISTVVLPAHASTTCATGDSLSEDGVCGTQSVTEPNCAPGESLSEDGVCASEDTGCAPDEVLSDEGICVTTTPEPMCLANQVESDSLPEDGITWNKTMSVAQYSGPGTLAKVILRVTAQARADVMVENQDQTPKSPTSKLSVSVDVENPDGSYTIALVEDARVVNLDAFDKTLDFAGPSSTRFDQTSGKVTEEKEFTDVSAFVGTGTISFPVSASGSVTITGSAAIAAVVTSFAQASIEVEYVCA